MIFNGKNADRRQGTVVNKPSFPVDKADYIRGYTMSREITEAEAKGEEGPGGRPGRAARGHAFDPVVPMFYPSIYYDKGHLTLEHDDAVGWWDFKDCERLEFRNVRLAQPASSNKAGHLANPTSKLVERWAMMGVPLPVHPSRFTYFEANGYVRIFLHRLKELASAGQLPPLRRTVQGAASSSSQAFRHAKGSGSRSPR